MEEKEINYKNYILPKGFSIKTLKPSDTESIYQLIHDHYVTDKEEIIRLFYHKDFIYWMFRLIPPGFAIGLVYNNKLVGMIVATLIPLSVGRKKYETAYVTLYCIQKKIRGLGLGKLLMDELQNRLLNAKISFALATNDRKKWAFCQTYDYVIPINHDKLRKIGFLTEPLDPVIRYLYNPLEKTKYSDLDQVVTKLNQSMEKLELKPHFTTDNAKDLLYPKKHITLSFVSRDENENVTDFINVYLHQIKCLESNEIIYVAQLGFYFHETLTLTELVQYLIDKLLYFGIDQLVFKNTNENSEINLIKYSTGDKLYYHFYNSNISQIAPEKLTFFPF